MDSSLLQENLKGMDSGQAKNKDLATGSDDGLESSIMDICHSSANDIYSTANSDTLIENLLKLQPDLQNYKERDERPWTGSEKNRDEYGVLTQKIREIHIGISKLKEENETPQNMRTGKSGQKINSQEHSASSQTVGYTESQIDSKLMQKEYSEGYTDFQKENIKIEAELHDGFRKSQTFQRTIGDLQKKLVNLEEENKALKTESLTTPLKNNDGAKWLVCDMENNLWSGVFKQETNEMKCKSSEQQEKYPLASTQNERNIEKERNNLQAELLLQTGKSSLRTEALCQLQGMKSSRDGTSNLLIENEDLRNDYSRQSDPMQEQITLLQQELQAKTELVAIQQKQIEDLLQALVKGNCENARLAGEHNKCMEERGDANTLQTELVRVQQEKQKLQKEFSAKLTELKSLHIMFSTLGREKEVMAAELVAKARILGDMEEDLNDVKEQNNTLSKKLEIYAKENKTKGRDIQETLVSLQNRNKLLAEQVLKTSEEYRSLKRKSKDLQEQNCGYKREIANLKASIIKQERLTSVLEAERATLVNEITWGKQQLQFLMKQCQCSLQETKSVTEQQLTKPDRQESLEDEIVFLEQLLLHFKEEIACIKEESDKGVKEHKKLKEKMAMLQNELSYLRAENSEVIKEKKLDENRGGKIKRLEDTSDVQNCKRESLQAEVADINMEKSKLKLDDARDLRNQLQLNELCMTQKQDDVVFSLKMAPGSEANYKPTMNQTMMFHVVDDLQISKPYSSEALLSDSKNAQALKWTADTGGRFESIGAKWSLSV